MKRRTFLKSAAASAALFPVPGTASLLRAPPAQAFQVAAILNEDLSMPHLIAVLDAFVDRSIPLACVVDPFGTDGHPLSQESKLAQVLNGYLLGNSGLDIVPYVHDLSLLSEHFQARAVFEAVSAIKSMLRPALSIRKSGLPVQSIACAEHANPNPPRGVRSAGILNVLTLPAEPGPVRSETWDNGVVRLFGGSLHILQETTGPAEITEQGSGQNLLYLSAKEFAQQPLNLLKKTAGKFTRALSQQELNGDLSLLPVPDIQLRDNYRFKKTICLHVLHPQKQIQAQVSAYSAFTAFLQETRVPHSTGRPSEKGREAGFWVPTELPLERTGSGGSLPGMSPIRAGSPSDAALRTIQQAIPGIGVTFPVTDAGRQGLGSTGILQLPKHVVSGGGAVQAFNEAVAGTADAVIFLHPDAFTFPPDRRALQDRLRGLHTDEGTQFLHLEQFVRALVPAGPLPSRQRKTSAAAPELLKKRRYPAVLGREELLEDARVAWRYFEKFSDPATGLCPATVNFAPGGRHHKAVTMWDVGSHINGLVAARQISLISQQGFETAIRKILPNIAGRTSQNRHLPQGWIRADRRKWGNKNFDGSDAGRLLAALDNLRRHSNFGDQLEELVASWDLQKVIIGGEVHSVVNGELKSSYVSHSAHYSALAFRRWGLAAKSPYEVLSDRSPADGRMALLEAASRIGPFGAEPLLLEAMELGMSRESAFLADVLFAAQLEEFQETGRLICVSEGPIDKSPWFLYQGLQLDAPKRTWAFDTVGQEPEYRTPEFREENLAISSKAAFLWSAYQPHEYSDKLTSFTRSVARTKNGFASSIYLKNEQPTEAYTDLNTNGVILQAIAHRLVSSGGKL